jgi:hypothetical protein
MGRTPMGDPEVVEAKLIGIQPELLVFLEEVLLLQA